MSIVDIVIIVILVLFAVIGLWKGFLKGCSSLIGYIVATVLSYLLRNPVAALLDKCFNITGSIYTKLVSKLSETSSVFTDFTSSDIVELKTKVNESSISDTLKKAFNSLIGNNNYPEPVSLGEIISSKIATLATIMIALLISFVLIRIVVIIVIRIIKKSIKNKPIGKIDRVLGLMFYTAKGGITIIVMFVLLSFLSMVPDVSPKIDGFLQNTSIAKAGYERVNEYILDKLGES